jgi:hypothetical protein
MTFILLKSLRFYSSQLPTAQISGEFFQLSQSAQVCGLNLLNHHQRISAGNFPTIPISANQRLTFPSITISANQQE